MEESVVRMKSGLCESAMMESVVQSTKVCE